MPSLSLLSSLGSVCAVCADLLQVDLITSEECENLIDMSDVVQVQSSKTSEVMVKTAEVLSRRGFKMEFKVLSGI